MAIRIPAVIDLVSCSGSDTDVDSDTDAEISSASWSVWRDRIFQPYDQATAAALETAWQAEKKEVKVNVGQHAYMVTLCGAMEQQVLENRSKKRSVRRIGPARGAATGTAPCPQGSGADSVPRAQVISGADSVALDTLPLPGLPPEVAEDAKAAVLAMAAQLAVISKEGFTTTLVCGPTGAGKSALLNELVALGVCLKPQAKPRYTGQQMFQPIVSLLASHLGSLDKALDRLNMIGLNSVPSWMQHFSSLSNGQQERFVLALQLESNVQLDDFGGFVDAHTQQFLAIGLARIVRKADLKNIVIASCNPRLAAWLQPSLLVVFSSDGTPRLTKNPAANPARVEIRLRYVTAGFDSDRNSRASTAAVVEEAQARGGRAEPPLSFAADAVPPPVLITVSSWVTIDRATIDACLVTGLATSQLGEKRHTESTFSYPKQLGEGPRATPRWTMAAVIGGSGSGKSLALREVCGTVCSPRCRGCPHRPRAPSWGRENSVAAQLAQLSGGRFDAASIASLLEHLLGLRASAAARPPARLSAGERALADVAHVLISASREPASQTAPIGIDEFLTRTDRPSAFRACQGLRKLMEELGLGRRQLIVATVHDDFIPFLKPDLLVLTSLKVSRVLAWPACGKFARQLCRSPAPPADPFATPRLNFELRTCADHPKEGGYTSGIWAASFKEHHYKDPNLNTNATADVLRTESGEPVGFVASIGHFGATDKRDTADEEKTKVRREHRVCILPGWQGLGLGPAMSDLSASMWTATPHNDAAKKTHPHWRYTCVTAHPRFGAYRDSNDKWQPTSGNHKTTDGEFRFAHEYVGPRHAFAPGEQRRVPNTGSGAKRARSLGAGPS